MKRFATISVLVFAALLFMANRSLAQAAYAPVTSPQGVPGYQFTNLPDDGDDQFSYRVTTVPTSIIQVSSTGGLPHYTNGHVYNLFDGNLTVWIQPPSGGGAVTVIVNYLVGGEPVEIIRATQTFGTPPVTLTPTLTVLGSSANPAPYGDQVTFTATVTGTGGTPTGTVTFKEGTTVLGTSPLNPSGIATFNKEGLSVGAHSITAAYGGDATFDVSSTSLNQTISQKTLFVVGITAADKIYDGNPTATLTIPAPPASPLAGVIAGESVTLNPGVIGTFNDKTVGLSKLVTISGLSISGANVGNYVLSGAAVTTTASITPKTITVAGVTATDKAYDGNAIAALNTSAASLVGVVSGDVVNLNTAGAAGAFDSKNVGTSKPVVVSGLTIVAADAGNYTLTQPTTSATISRAAASVVPAVASKVYGTADPVLTGTLTGFVSADNVTATYSRVAGETVVSSPYTISAVLNPTAALDNYTVTYGTAAFTITKATASVTPNAATKIFGTTDPTLTGTLAGFVAADNVTAIYTRAAGETVAGSPYAITATLSPAAVLPNYNITYNTANFTITKNISATALISTAAATEYGQTVTFTATVTGAGTPSGTVTFKDGSSPLGTGTLNGYAVATLSVATIKVAGSPHSITAVYAGDANFEGSTSGAVQQTVTPKPLTVSGITASDKIYDGTVHADLNTGSAALVGVVNGDNVNLHAQSAVGVFADKNAGTGKTVTVTGIFMNGTDSDNYTLSQPSLSATITKAAASVVPAPASKVYGTVDPTLTGTLTGFVGADNVTAAYSRVAGETVASSPYAISATLSPASALDNYTITYGSAAFAITKATASVTPNAATKVFGTPDPTLTGTLTGFMPVDNVTATYSRTAGETVTGSPYVISATLNPAAVLPNYNITYNTANFTIAKNLSTTALASTAAATQYGQSVTFTATVTGAGTPSGTVTFKDGSSTLGTGTLNGSAVATLTVSTLTVAGSPHSVTAVYAGDGNFGASTSTTVQQTVTAKPLTVNGITASDKIYDATTHADLSAGSAALVGVVNGDQVTLNTLSAVGVFADKNVGTGKAVTVTGITISGTNSDNYTLTQPALSASITKAAASVVPAPASKVYGTVDPTLSGTLTGFVGADNVTAAYSRAAGETVASSPYAISATLSPTGALDNYTITYGSAAFTITKATASVTPNAATKVFGTPDPTLTGTLTGFVPADNVTATYSRTAGESVAGSPYTISATLSPATVLPNYTITYNTATFGITTNTTTTALVTSAPTAVYGQQVTFTATVSGAGTPTGSVTFKDGATIIGSGTLNGSGVATFSTSTLLVAGSPHSITAVYGGNVNLAGSTSSAVQQTITPKGLTVGGITAGNKVYDGNANAVLNTSAAALTGAVAGDDVSLNVASAAGSFNDKNAGTNKPVSVTGLTITGAAAPNYALTQPATTANITIKNLTVTGITASNKIYDGTTAATVNTSGAVLVGVVSGDNVSLNASAVTGTFSDNAVGTNKTVTIAGLTLGGTDAGNYTLTQPTTTANITAAPVNTGSTAGAGWIASPAGAFVSTPSATGRDYFVFAAAYIGQNPVTPTGALALELKTKGLFYPSILSFASSHFDALVVSGSKATLKGTGTISGSGSYGFLMSVIQGQGLTGNKFRIKIWNKNNGNAVVYDSQMGAGDDATPTGAVTGLIGVSQSGGSTAAPEVSVQQLIEQDAATEIPTQFELHNAYPNPFNPSTTIRFDLPENTKVRLAVYDMLGREVAVLAEGERPAGQYTLHFDASKLSTGIYIYRLQAGNFTQTKKLMLMK